MYSSAFWRIAEALRDIALAVRMLAKQVGRCADHFCLEEVPDDE